MARRVIPWAEIEAEYRAGQLSVRQLGAKFKMDHTSIHRKAKKEGWSRDLSDEVRREMHRRLVYGANSHNEEDEKRIIDDAAKTSTEIVRSHRKDIAQGRGTVAMLMEELREGTADRILLRELVEQAADEEEYTKQRRRAIEKATSLPSRAAIMRDLSQSMHKLQALERQAFNIDKQPGEKDPLQRVLEAISDTSRGIGGYGNS